MHLFCSWALEWFHVISAIKPPMSFAHWVCGEKYYGIFVFYRRRRFITAIFHAVKLITREWNTITHTHTHTPFRAEEYKHTLSHTPNPTPMDTQTKLLAWSSKLASVTFRSSWISVHPAWNNNHYYKVRAVLMYLFHFSGVLWEAEMNHGSIQWWMLVIRSKVTSLLRLLTD